jgi:hypothetical protein
MIKLITLIESYVRIEKASTGLTVADGEAGRGIYFSVGKYPDMIKYYQKGMEGGFRIVKAVALPNTKIIDFTSPKLLGALIDFMRKEIVTLSKRMQGYIPPKIDTSNYQRFGRLIEDYIRIYHPKIDGYIVHHQADKTNLPKGKQLIIINEESFDYEESPINEMMSPHGQAKDANKRRGYIGVVYKGIVEAYDEIVPDVMAIDHSEFPHGRRGSSSAGARWRYFMEQPNNVVLWNERPFDDDRYKVEDWLAKKGIHHPKHIDTTEYINRYLQKPK